MYNPPDPTDFFKNKYALFPQDFPKIPKFSLRFLQVCKSKVLPKYNHIPLSEQNNHYDFNLIYWEPICGIYFLVCSFWENMGK